MRSCASPLTLEQYRDSRLIVEPLRRDDCCLVSDGAAAVVLMSAKKAAELKVAKPVPVLGFGQGQTSWDVALRPDLTTTAAKVSAQTAFAMAGLKPADMDVAQIYDCFTIAVLMTLEDYGFCAKGEGGPVCAGRAHRARRRAADQHRGRPALGDRHARPAAGDRRRAPDARRFGQPGPGRTPCAISNQGGIMHTHSTLILGH
jgi:acetyl-CoA acetyltransferase